MKKKVLFLFLCMSIVIISWIGFRIINNNNELEKSNEDLIQIGFSQVGAESDWRVANTKSMKSALSPENGFELIYSDAQQKQENQIKAVRDFISQEVDIIAIAPVTESGWETVLKEAKSAGIPVIIVDRKIKVADTSLFTCWVGSDFEKEGKSAAQWLIDNLKSERRENDNCNVVVLQGTIGSSAELGRTKGFNDSIKAYKNIHILSEQSGEFTQAKGQEVMDVFLKEFNNINVVVTQNDNMAFGAIDAIKAIGKKPGKDIKIISYDAVRSAFISMIRGEMNVSVECNPLHGPRVASLAKKIIHKQKIDKYQYVEEKVYTAENAKAELPNRQY